MNLRERVAALAERFDFLCDAYVQGMVDGPDVDRVGRLLQEAKAELAKDTP